MTRTWLKQLRDGWFDQGVRSWGLRQRRGPRRHSRLLMETLEPRLALSAASSVATVLDAAEFALVSSGATLSGYAADQATSPLGVNGVVACGASSGTQSAQLVIPLYQYPLSAPKTLAPWWNDVRAAASSELPITVVISPAVGPANPATGGAAYNDYLYALEQLRQNPNVRILGYVATGYGHRSLTDIVRDVTWYETGYKQSSTGASMIDGIFLDEVNNTTTYLQNYATVYANIHARTGLAGCFVMGNPGCSVPVQSVSRPIADAFIVFEGTATNFYNNSMPSYVTNPTYASIGFGAIVHGVSGSAAMLQVVNTGLARQLDYLFVTNDTMPNPYDTGPSYWAEELAALRASYIAPVLSGLPASATIPELEAYTFTAMATDANLPARQLMFRLLDLDADHWVPTGATIDSGSGEFTWTPSEAQGSGVYSFQVAVSNGVVSTAQTIVLTVEEAVSPTTIAVVSGAPGGSVYGEAVTFTATVSASLATGIPTGSAQFVVDGASVGSPVDLVNGTASMVVSSLGVGAHSLDVIYTSNDSERFLDSQTATPLAIAVSKASATLTLASSLPEGSAYGQPVTFTAIVSALDPSTAIPTGNVLFMDGKRSMGLASLDNGVARFTVPSVGFSRGQHTVTAVYLGHGNWEEGATASVIQTVQTTALQPDPLDPSKSILVVDGTSSTDLMYVSYSSGTGRIAILVHGGINYLTYFDAADLSHIVLRGAAGRDLMHVSAGVPLPVLMLGGDGNDLLWGGSAGSVLVGGDGNDLLQGGSGRDVLIGGLGSDYLNGQGDQDILIGGTTDCDDDLAALEVVLAEWRRTDASLIHRYQHLLGPDHGGLAGGRNDAVHLNPATVYDDAARDFLLDRATIDWFFASSGTTRDLLAAGTLGKLVTYYS